MLFLIIIGALPIIHQRYAVFKLIVVRCHKIMFIIGAALDVLVKIFDITYMCQPILIRIWNLRTADAKFIPCPPKHLKSISINPALRVRLIPDSE